MRTLLLIPLFFAFTGNAAADDWPDSLRDSVYEGCMLDAESFGIAKKDAPLTCLCFTVTVENEWPLRQFGELLAAIEEPHDSPANQRLGEIVRSCRE